MQITPQVAVYVLLLVPGLLGHALFSAFTYTAKPTWSGRTVVAILLSAISYTSLAVLRSWDTLAWLPEPVSLLNAAEKGVPATVAGESLLCVLGACVMSVIFSLLFVAVHNRRTLFLIAQKLGLTTKSGFESEWDSAMMLRARSRWVMVLMKDGSAFTGWLESHDVSSVERALVLSKIREYDKDGLSFEWPADELLYINGLADVRALRLIPHKEPSNEHATSTEPAPTTTQDRDQVGEYEPHSSPEGTAARLANETDADPSRAEVIDNTTELKELKIG